MKILTTLALLIASSAAGAQEINLIKDGDFENETLALSARDAQGLWVLRNHGAEQASVKFVAASDGNSSRCMRYRNTGQGSHNIHVDQVVPVTPDQVYQVTARVRGDGQLEPMIAIQTMAWTTLASVSCGQSTGWREIKLLFHSYDNEQVRFEWFPGATGRLHTGVAGTSWLDDVHIELVEHPAPSLLRSFALQRPQQDDEIDLTQISQRNPGNPLPLRRITACDGVLLYEDGTEVALWGVNIQTALSWEYKGRLKPLGVPHTAQALKDISARNLEQLELLEANVIRMHLLPADFSGPAGEIRDSIYLDVLDDLLAQCRRRGIYVYLTLMNEMGQSFLRDSFVAEHDRAAWIFDPQLAEKSRRYVREFLNRKNRYTGARFADDPTIAVVEIMNEPRYPTLAQIQSDPEFGACREAFDAWRASLPGDPPAQAVFPTYRYQLVLDYLNRMCATVRKTDCPAPVIWNLNWPRMISAHEDVFQAAADSAVDGVSFCCYPGQCDVAHPFWANPADLSGNNYLPYLQTCYRDYAYLRWMLGKRFAKKAKMAYEFESMYNHSAWLYPAMARLFRSLGAQIAPMWQYTLTPVAEYRAGSHYLNAYCTPRKAVSFRIASRVFSSTPRCTPFDLAAQGELVEPKWLSSFEKRLSLWRSREAFLYSGDVARETPGIPVAPRLIVGCGSSSLVTYDGTGLYTMEINDDQARLRILPDVRYRYPTWQRSPSNPPQRVCVLDTNAEHFFELHMPGWTDNVEVVRLERDQALPVVKEGGDTRFRARPGQYRLSRRD